jgi:hypothetical protein
MQTVSSGSALLELLAPACARSDTHHQEGQKKGFGVYGLATKKEKRKSRDE